MPGAEVARHLGVDASRGLSPGEIAERQARYGPNRLPEPPRPHWVLRLLRQFLDPLVGALLVAAVVAAVVASTEPDGSYADTIAILLIVALNAALGFFQEARAEAALESLQKMAAPNAKRVSGGAASVVPASELVPGDVVEVEAGDSVPADVRLVESAELSVEEAALTGESVPVDKRADRVLDADTGVADRTNVVFTGTTVTRGRGRGVVVYTAVHTELGRIGAMLEEARREPTPLERRLARLGKAILIACLIISAGVFGIGIAQASHAWTFHLLVAVSLAVAAIPEGLPAITTITLALGMQRMARRGAIVRKLPAVETLGSATVICTDKTGTLTENAMTVRVVDTVDGSYRVTGEGYAPDGRIEADGPLPEPLRRLLRAGVLCNSSSLVRKDGEWAVVGDPTEAALLVLADKGGLDRDGLRAEVTVEREVPFDSDRKRMSVVVRRPDGTLEAHVKGSADALLDLCDRMRTAEGVVPITEEVRRRMHERNEELAQRALRVLALAERDDPDDADPENGLVFLGLAAMMDPPRAEAKQAVAECHSAGIRVAMITGDHRLTAVAIARELGIWQEGRRALTGAELEALDDAGLAEIIDDVAVFARVTAEQKLRIVRALQRRGHIVAMTGDGVNDAPALQQAPIGVAMGLAGTDVARQAAEMVLADDNFATIVHAVREGRAIFRNIRKFIFFLGSSNAGLVMAVIALSFMDFLPPLTPLQLLWINLVTNGMPALALGIDPPEPSLMREGPRPPKQGIVGLRDLLGVLLVGGLMSGAALFLYTLPALAPELFSQATPTGRLEEARTMAFTLLAVSPLFHAFNCRSPVASIFRVGLFTNRFLWIAIATSAAVHLITFVAVLRPIFLTHPLSIGQWGVIVALAFLPVPVVETLKLLERRLFD